MSNEKAWARAQRAARASYMDPKEKKSFDSTSAETSGRYAAFFDADETLREFLHESFLIHDAAVIDCLVALVTSLLRRLSIKVTTLPVHKGLTCD